MAQYDDYSPFPVDPELVENPEPRCPCLLLLDTSTSMRGEPIDELNEGLVAFRDEMAADQLAAKRVEVGILSFGPVDIIQEFVTADEFQPPTLIAKGDTPMGAAIEKGIDIVEQRKSAYRQARVAYYRPWIFLITDGGPTDEWERAADLVHAGEESKSFVFRAIGVQQARMDVLERISVRQPLRLKELRFRDLFEWLSRSLRATSTSDFRGEEDQIPLESPVGPGGWATVG